MQDKFEIFTTSEGNAEIHVKFEGETFWLNLNQIARLFNKDKSVISRHLKNIFESLELKKEAVVAKNATTAFDGKTYKVEYYNLDAILSVGYRVNSIRGTQFRQWATKRLKDYLTEGLIINENRLEQKSKEIRILHDGIRILSRAIDEKVSVSGDFHWLQIYGNGLKMLDDYDHDALDIHGLSGEKSRYPEHHEYASLIEHMRRDIISEMFGRIKDSGFESAIRQVGQCFDGSDLYPSIEEKAAMLLYLIVKNHAFVDGNKRIAAACFLLFIKRNQLLFKSNGDPVLSNEALAGLTLFVAISKPEEMETVRRLLVSVLNRARIS